jgi:hypothetical protein
VYLGCGCSAGEPPAKPFVAEPCTLTLSFDAHEDRDRFLSSNRGLILRSVHDQDLYLQAEGDNLTVHLMSDACASHSLDEMGFRGADKEVTQRTVTSVQGVQEMLGRYWASNQVDVGAIHRCVVRFETSNDEEWAALATLLPFSGLDGVQVGWVDGTVFIGAEDSCSMTYDFVSGARETLYGGGVSGPANMCDRASFEACGPFE